MRTAQLFQLVTLVAGSLAACRPRGLDLTALKAKLSADAEIISPSDSSFNETALRWSTLDAPTPNVIVVPAVEEDVVQTVLFANANSVPFLATNGAHGALTTLGRMTTGIEIYLEKLASIKIASDGSSVTVGGGVRSKNVTDALWAANKQTVTGTCECVGYLGPALGGGHGWLQGHHGLVSDQFLSVNLVLANGTLITVTASSNPDLFWALQGAGHNFGIVTSVTSRIYDIVHPNYALQTIIFSGAEVEQVYALANKLWLPGGVSNQPATFHQWSYWFYESEIDASAAVIALYLIEEGVDAVNATVVAAFEAIGPIISTPSNGTYLDLASWTGIDLDSTPCQKTGKANPRFPIYLTQFNTTAVRQAYDLFSNATSAADSPYTGSLFMFEGYAQEGVKSVGDSATAFAYRSDNILGAPMINYADTGSAIEERSYNLGTQIRDALWAGANGGVVGETGTLHTYVNYAYGDETADSWYGDVAWRQNKLQSLKKTYDPNGRFSFYAPIA
ncbi:FAD-binding domain containing protein [Grosmannia clavigera kw1407]|uniref:FAD-binding domain containing protein n=1 Tax=Grosmannia clavigera (strain kw1407 / UAMH 11150) TaxID=655863 RepID=F0XQG6_GROCL|nr:FAD-binding domain containing protein [Grosmannia clavigera kw1407]EFX00158.1 FAD-binding domain containing protein [Grosmannia clavigera kw1407]